MSFDTDDFAPEEIAMLRDFFRDEAHEALEKLTKRILSLGASPLAESDADELMRTTHTLKGSAGTVQMPAVVEYSHRLENQFALLRDGALPWSAAVQDCIVEIIDGMRALVDVTGDDGKEKLAIERLDGAMAALDSQPGPGELHAAPKPPAAETETPSADEPVEASVAEASGPSDGVPPPYRGPNDGTRSIVAGEVSGPTASTDVLRVDPARIDQLMNSVGELVFDRTRIERRVQRLRSLTKDLGRTRQQLRNEIGSIQSATREATREEIQTRLRELEAALAEQVTHLARSTATLLDDTDALRRTSTSLQEGLTRVRMQTAGALFQRIAPQFRYIARAAGKRIHLATTGDATEFDKTVAEQISDPLIQLLRNAVAHGIESAEERTAAGKSADGTIRIDARHEGGIVVLEVSDDGAGINPAALRRKFVDSGRWTQARAKLSSDEDVLHAIFDPGMSSRDEADQLAGRGVGLDVARETIAQLGGEIQMTSTPGKGTTFTMRLPVSTAVSQALLFKVHGQVYALPNVHVVETAQVPTEKAALPSTITVRDDPVPLVSMHDVLDLRRPSGARALPAIVIDYAGKRLAITCDKIVGARQIVLKHLGQLLAPLPLYAGGTISGSGKVQLIFDTAALMRLAYPGSHPVDAPAAPQAVESSSVLGRALVADDSRAIREALTRILARAGYIVDVAEDGARAWDMLRELRYDVLFTDLEMPKTNGFELIRQLREDDRYGNMPVIVVSSRATSVNRKRAKDLAVITFVAKPVTRKKVIDALKRI
jgi:chemotaxis protein histidine kinase CheA/CheY-like chemotaxis protein